MTQNYKWIIETNYLCYCDINTDFNGFKNKKIAAFDLDDTIIKTKSGKVFAKSENDWTILNESLFIKLLKLHIDGYKLMLISNQHGIGKGTLEKKMWMNKIESIILFLGLNITVFCSINDDCYRKPRTKIWDKFINGNLNSSFFSGDAGGLPGDFSDSDLKFAKNVGIKFIHIKEFLDNKKINYKVKYPIDFSLINYGKIIKFQPDKKEVIINLGFPASGKSYYTKKNILPHNYILINKDTLKTEKKCLQLLEKSLQEHKNIVIDNTNLSKEIRKNYLDIILPYKYKVRCFWFNTPYDICIHNSYFRNFITDNKVPIVPKIVYNIMKKKFSPPEHNEGFSEIKEINFILELDDKEKRLYEQYFY